MTGSIHTGSLEPPRNALRPRFVWEPVVGATGYEVQLSSQCEAATRQTCAFPSPLSRTSSTTEWQPPDDLEVSTSAPVGRRYYWRVRACRETECFEWSEVRYVDVGRMASDLDGDGYGDLAVRQRGTTDALVRTFRGPALTDVIDGSESIARSSALALIGDFNGDGFSDIVARDRDGGVCVLFGNPAAAMECGRQGVIPPVDGVTAFGTAFAGAGDLDGDGFADIAVGSPGHADDSGRVDWYRGGGVAPQTPTLTLLPPSTATGRTRFGTQCSAWADRDGDGLADLVVGSPGETASTLMAAGRAHWYAGGGALSTTPTQSLSSGAPELNGYFGFPLHLGDANADGFGDGIVVSAGELGSEGRVHLFEGGRTPAAQALTTIEMGSVCPSCASLSDGTFEWPFAAAAGDFDGDGRGDAVLAVKGGGTVGVAVALLTNGTFSSDPRLLPAPVDASSNFATAIASSDVDGDGCDEIAVGEVGVGTAGRVVVYRYESASLMFMDVATLASVTGDADFGRAIAVRQ